MKPDPEPWYSTTLNLWQVAGVLVATWTLIKALTEGWRRTVGRRRYVTTRLRKIAAGVRHDYVESLLREPRWQSTMQCTRIGSDEEPEEADGTKRIVELTVRTWLLSKLCYLVTWCENDRVVVYGITTTSWWFQPWVRVHETRIRLGKSTFADLADHAVIHRAWLGNRRFGYFEEHYFGNVGGYRSWYVGVNDFGYDAFPVATDWFDDSDIRHTQLLPVPRERYRASAPINTVVVSGIALYEEMQDGTFFGISLGVDQDLVRLADPEYHVLDSRIGRAHRRIRAWRGGRRYRRWEKRQQAGKRQPRFVRGDRCCVKWWLRPVCSAGGRRGPSRIAAAAPGSTGPETAGALLPGHRRGSSVLLKWPGRGG